MRHWTSDKLTTRVHDRAVAGLYPLAILLHAPHPVAIRKAGGNLIGVHTQIDPIVHIEPFAQGDLTGDPTIPDCERRCDPHVDALRVHVEPRQRHVVLPAASPPSRPNGVSYTSRVEPSPIPRRFAPNRRHDLRCFPSRTVWSEVEDRIVDGSAMGFTLVDANHDVGPSVPGRCPILSVVWLGTTTAWSTARCTTSSPSQMVPESIQIGVPGINASGKTTSPAPSAAACRTRSTVLSSVASRSISTYAAWTAAATIVSMGRPLPAVVCTLGSYRYLGVARNISY